MKMLITGGAGFIGSHLCDKYTKEGHSVFCLDNFMSGNLMNIRHLLDCRNFKLIKGDIRDFNLLEKIMCGVDVVFHLAAQVHVDRSYIEPQLTYDVNVIGTQNILEVARLYDAKKVIYTSTSEVYGSAQYVPIDEQHPLNAPHPYGASKIAADRICISSKGYSWESLPLEHKSSHQLASDVLGISGTSPITKQNHLTACLVCRNDKVSHTFYFANHAFSHNFLYLGTLLQSLGNFTMHSIFLVHNIPLFG
jgi:hypothetical protein